ncbi:T9SS type A sorting domain-containing protein [Chitinophagaceae bacterium MMS25-I14]
MKKNLAVAGCLLLSSAAFGQNGWLPTVTLPGGTVCDPSPWQLVFSDDFNGTTLSPPWLKYLSWNGIYVVRGNDTIPQPYHQYWADSRTDPGPSILKDENVIVSNGTCKLLLASDPNSSLSYHDSTKQGNPLVTISADYSSGIITLPLYNQDWSHGYFNSGRFESRIKFPNFDGAWCAFWLWYGTKVDELDMAESWGGNGSYHNFYQNRRHTNYAIHAWAPPQNQNPYGLPGECNITEHYPNQSAWQYIMGGYFHQENWHTYAYEWDTASVAAYLDGSLIETMWKYSRKGFKPYLNIINGISYYTSFPFTIGSGCQTNQGTYDITYGYPYYDTAQAALRLETKWASHPDYNLGYKYILGQMEVDYVRIWQRHPEIDGHKAICADNTYPATPTITGPNEVCGQVSYTLSPAVAGGTWNTCSQLDIYTSSSSGITVAKNAGPSFNTGYISYSYGNGNSACPLKTVYKSGIYCNKSTPWQVAQVFSCNNIGNSKIHFITEPYVKRDVINGTTPVVQWNVSVNVGKDAYDPRTAVNYVMYGEYASTPSFTFSQGAPYNVRWTMKAYTSGPDTIIRSGERNSRTKTLQQIPDTNAYYFNAYIDNQDDFDTTVIRDVPTHMISEDEYRDDLFVSEMIEKSRADALSPYIITTGMQNLSRKTIGANAPSVNTKVYPNPVQSNMTIILGSQFATEGDVQLNIYDLMGKLIKTWRANYHQGDIIQYDLNEMTNGNYILELKQDTIKEHVKILKTGN